MLLKLEESSIIPTYENNTKWKYNRSYPECHDSATFKSIFHSGKWRHYDGNVTGKQTQVDSVKLNSWQ